jgi:hypothetical protein
MLPSKRDGSQLLQSQLADDQVVAKIFVESGYFKLASLPQALTKIIIGREMGLSAATAIQGLFIIPGTGKIGLETWLMQSLVDKDPRGFTWKEIEHTNGESYTLEFFRKGESIGSRTYTLDDARRNGLLGKDNWKANPDNMIFWRCLGRGLRELCNFTFGQMQAYTRDEIEDEDFGAPAAPAPLDTLRDKVKAKMEPKVELEIIEGEIVEEAPEPTKIEKKAARSKAALDAQAPPTPKPSPEPVAAETPVETAPGVNGDWDTRLSPEEEAELKRKSPPKTVEGEPIDANPETGEIRAPQSSPEAKAEDARPSPSEAEASVDDYTPANYTELGRKIGLTDMQILKLSRVQAPSMDDLIDICNLAEVKFGSVAAALEWLAAGRHFPFALTVKALNDYDHLADAEVVA